METDDGATCFGSNQEFSCIGTMQELTRNKIDQYVGELWGQYQYLLQW